jgi:hypothetical protein
MQLSAGRGLASVDLPTSSSDWPQLFTIVESPRRDTIGAMDE